MTFEKLITLCKPIDVSGPEPSEIGALTQDSREVVEGSVFIAVPGTQVDGHIFIENAIARGASVVICEESFYSDKKVCIIEVVNTRQLVGPLAQAFEDKPAEKLKIIGITGTNGKTTVATLTYQLLKKMGARPSLLGTVAKRIDDKVLNSLLTTSDPIELARDMRRMVEANSTHLVMEVSSHALDQKRVSGINFDVAAFTNLSHDHLDYHKSFREYINTKKQLFDDLNTDAWAIINADDKQAKLIALDCPARIIDFSFRTHMTVDCRITSSTSGGLTLHIEGTEFVTPLVGKFNAYNVTEAILICHTLGYEYPTIARAVTSAPGAAGRLERVDAAYDTPHPLILVDYAHTPNALENVLSTLADLKTDEQNLHVIFGCGGNRDKTKRPGMAAAAETYADIVTITSDNPRDENPDEIINDAMKGFKHPERISRITDRKKAIEEVIANASTNTIILIAGKGHETYQEVKGKRLHFDDREISKTALDKRNKNTDPSADGGV